MRLGIPPLTITELSCGNDWPDNFVSYRSDLFPIPLLSVNRCAFVPAFKSEGNSALNKFVRQLLFHLISKNRFNSLTEMRMCRIERIGLIKPRLIKRRIDTGETEM